MRDREDKTLFCMSLYVLDIFERGIKMSHLQAGNFRILRFNSLNPYFSNSLGIKIVYLVLKLMLLEHLTLFT